MSYVDGWIGQPVSINDVQRALATTRNDLGELCMHPNVNMWSEFKPIYSTKIERLVGADDWKGTHNLANYKTGAGIKKYAPTGFAYFNNVDTNTGNPESNVWSHDKPILGESVFRLTDFAGYYQKATNVVTVFSYITNLKNIPIPSTDTPSSAGTEIEFLMYMAAKSGSVTPSYLFHDCENFYPAVILSYGNGNYNYVTAASQTIKQLRNGTDLTASVKVNTADFARAIGNQTGSSTPYAIAPLLSGCKWTACMVLVSNNNFSRLVSGSGVQIVRLEYEKDVDRWTLPVLQSKWSIINSMTIHVGLRRYTNLENNNYVYKIQTIYVDADMASAESITFSVTATLACHVGTVSVSGASSTTNVNCGSITFSGQTGLVRKTVDINETTYIITNTTTAGNQICSCDVTLHNVGIQGDFIGRISIDAAGGPGYPSKDVDLF